jgi:hypothetical protein
VIDGGMVPLVLHALRQAGWKATRIQAGTARGHAQHLADAGWPDVIAIGPRGRTALLECKSDTGELSSAQLEFRAWAEEHGHEYRVVRDARDVEEVLCG